MHYFSFMAGALVMTIVTSFLNSRRFRPRMNMKMYGMDYEAYDGLPSSKKARVRFEYYLDNNKDDIEFIDKLRVIKDENRPLTAEDAQLHLSRLERMRRKYDSLYETDVWSYLAKIASPSRENK